MRASIARALVTEPHLLLMDEPFAALDEITRFKLNNDLLTLWQQIGRTVIFVTHSVFEVGLSIAAHRGDDAASRAACSPNVIPAPYPRDETFRTSADMPAIAALVSEALEQADARRAMSDAPASRVALPTRRAGALLCGLGRLRCASTTSRPMCCPGPRVFPTLIADWGLLSHSLLVTLTTTWKVSCRRRRRHRSRLLFNLSRLIEYSLFFPTPWSCRSRRWSRSRRCC